MSNKKRLFIFAGYDQHGIIDDALIHYVRTLQLYGDVIFCMDNTSRQKQIKRIKRYTIATLVTCHHEYDFGSYKRGFQYARDKGLLENYEYIYLVNDSVFGPLFSMKKLIHKMERIPKDAVGLVVAKHKTHSYMESWFVRLNKKIFMSPWFDEFISSVQQEQEKHIITIKYEHGLTKLIENHLCSWTGVYTIYGRETYNNPKHLFNNGCPFVKKASFTRHDGALGKQIKYVLKHSDENYSKYIMNTANRLYGEKYMKKFLTYNPIKILFRNIKYGIKKLIHGEI